MTARFCVFALISLLLVSCRAPATRHPVAHRAPVDPAVERLIDELVMMPSRQNTSSPSSQPTWDRWTIPYAAVRQLTSYGKEAFPDLLNHLADERPGICLRRVAPCTVGGACFAIIEDQIVALPAGYPASIYRTGADGRDRIRPRFGYAGPFDWETIEQWLDDRANRSLTEMQIEALAWVLAEERKIGFPTEEDRERIERALEREIARLKAGVAG